MEYRRVTSQILVGAVVVLLGVVLLAETTGIYDADRLLVYVPSLFVLVGLFAVVASGFRNLFGPLAVVIVAGGWQLVALDVLAPETVFSLWPVLLVLFGLSLIAGQYRARAVARESDFLTSVAVFGGRAERSTSKTFHGADLTAAFGGVELDLRDAVVEHPPATINANALFGAVEVVVPREWNVRVDVLPILAGAEDERPRREAEHDEVDLVITGFALFGGVAVQD
ncbi:LiaF transmembrane domain-containing protein [Halosimplex halophilum]|uniref:LiaF transmembrane domain-containing protein n=1 Tax=Halosimplex halophilum TaxID=2559572 RepID=UPI00107F2803|nr:LiaF domain-containing protein [Halosimplex halophilum]